MGGVMLLASGGQSLEDVTKHPTMHQASLTTRKDLAQNVDRQVSGLSNPALREKCIMTVSLH